MDDGYTCRVISIGQHKELVTLIMHAPHLLADELGNAGLVLPLAKEKLTQKGVKRLLFVAILLASAGILLLQCG